MCLGDKPELAFKEYRATLAALGVRSTTEYVASACEAALHEGLLPAHQRRYHEPIGNDDAASTQRQHGPDA